MSSQATTLSFDAVRRLPWAAKLNAAGLVMAAAGMFVQIAGGSTLYPTITGPVVLIAAAIVVLFGPARAAPWVGLAVSLVLGVGAIVAAVMTGDFIDQLTGFDRPGLVVGSLMHAIGLIVAIAVGFVVVLNRREAARRGR